MPISRPYRKCDPHNTKTNRAYSGGVRMQTRQYEPGEVIFRENDIGEIAYVIVSGRVEVLKNLGGQNIHIAYIGAGEPFGEMSMIDEKPRSATIVAVER